MTVHFYHDIIYVKENDEWEFCMEGKHASTRNIKGINYRRKSERYNQTL